jgi:hypothetical protein
LSIKTKLIGGTSALVFAGGMMAAAAAAPASAAVVTVGTCNNLIALGTAKSTTINPGTGKAYGIADVDNIDGAIGSKGVDRDTLKGTDLGHCNFVGGQGVPDNNTKPTTLMPAGNQSILKWGTKLFSREFDCDTTDTGDTTEWAPSGALSFTFTSLNSLGKNRALTAAVTVDGFTDPDNNPGTPSDVVELHGIVSKGIALGADVSGSTEFDPTVKDKTATYPGSGAYFGYNFDLLGAIGCTTATQGDANILTFNNGDNGAGQSQLLGLPVAGITFSKGTA